MLGLDGSGRDARDRVSGSGATAGGAARTDDRTRILDALSSRSPRTVDDLSRRAGMSPDRIVALLGLLSLEGRAERAPLGWLSRG